MKLKEMMMSLNEYLSVAFDDIPDVALLEQYENYSIFHSIFLKSQRTTETGTEYRFPWLNSMTKVKDITNDYYLGHSGEKTISPYAFNMVRSYKAYMDEETPKFPFNTKLAGEIIGKFGLNWDKLYQAMVADYNPLNNYDMTETEKANSKIENTTKSGIFGFDSSTSSPVADGESTTEGLKDDNERTLIRSGNIGVMSTQDLLNQEMSIREKNFLDMVFRDIDSILTLSIYE